MDLGEEHGELLQRASDGQAALAEVLVDLDTDFADAWLLADGDSNALDMVR